jgi:hypothetical protein
MKEGKSGTCNGSFERWGSGDALYPGQVVLRARHVGLPRGRGSKECCCCGQDSEDHDETDAIGSTEHGGLLSGLDVGKVQRHREGGSRNE